MPPKPDDKKEEEELQNALKQLKLLHIKVWVFPKKARKKKTTVQFYDLLTTDESIVCRSAERDSAHVGIHQF